MERNAVGDENMIKVGVVGGTGYTGVELLRLLAGHSGVELVAPVNIGAGATVGAGSTIGKDAPEGELTLERAKQTTIKGWRRPKKIDNKNK